MSWGANQLLCPKKKDAGGYLGLGAAFSLGLKTKDMELKELGEKMWPAEVPISQHAWEIRFCLFPGTHAMCVWLGIVLLIFPTCSQAL